MHKNVRIAALGLAAAGAVMAGGVLSASAASVEPEFVAGNPACSGLKIEPVADGTYGPITIDVTGSSFDFWAADGTTVTTVIVKGGPNANVYHYASPGVSSDTDLSAPLKGSRPYGLSHICFDVDDDKDPDPTSTPK